MTSTKAFITSALLLVLVGCGKSSSSPIFKVPVGDSPQRGPADAWVTIVEFADFECPFCRAEQPILADIEAAYAGDVRVVFKHFPLTAIHPHAQAAALAAQCASDQGKFWEMHDLLFTTALDDATLVADAEQIPGLDVAGWQACTSSMAAASRVSTDVALGTELGIDGTPTFVVNGTPVVGAVPENDLRTVIDHARAAATASGIPRADYYDKAVLGR